jgi:hypothetical protein
MKEKVKNGIGLSAHSLNIFRECQRCFYLQVRYNIKRPRGPIPSIATGIDSLIKEYFEYYRQKDELPPFLKEKIDGKLITNLKKTYYYHIEDFPNYYLWGHLDEAIKLPNNLYIPLDHKTRASSLKGEPHEAYKFQLGIYSLLLKETNKGQEVDIAYLVFYYPEKKLTDFDANEIKNVINFNFEVKEVKININEIKRVIYNAIDCLESNNIPCSGQDCEYCKWLGDIINDENIIKVYFQKGDSGNDKIKKNEMEEKLVEEEKFKDGKLF